MGTTILAITNRDLALSAKRIGTKKEIKVAAVVGKKAHLRTKQH